MTLSQIAVGGTYTLRDAELGYPTVVVESLDVHYTCTPGFYRSEALLQRALVWVYEPARKERYPTDAHHLCAQTGA